MNDLISKSKLFELFEIKMKKYREQKDDTKKTPDVIDEFYAIGRLDAYEEMLFDLYHSELFINTEPIPDIQSGDQVRHTERKLANATVVKWSASGLKVGVRYNWMHPRGVAWITSYFDPKYIRKVESPNE